MDRRVVVEAPAKINLHLRVLGRRADGFHDILSLFQALSLCDILDIRIGSGRGVRLSGDFDCPPSENMIVRAARAYCRAAGIRDGMDIRAQKRIPSGAGLGGGSSDAAATLLALNRAYEGRLDAGELGSLGAALGSDVLFFLQGPCAVVTGRGEKVDPVEGRSDFSVAILYPGFPSPTAAAYAAVDATRAEGAWGSGGAVDRDGVRLREEYGRNPAQWPFSNDFYEALAREQPEYRRAYEALKETRADYISLTGSGSAFFGVYRTPSAAKQAADTLNGREGSLGRWFSTSAAPLARMPVPRLE